MARSRNDLRLAFALRSAAESLPIVIADCPTKYHLAVPTRVTLDEVKNWGLEEWATFPRWWERQTKRFGCAIISGGALCGVALGAVSKTRSAVQIPMIESNPLIDHPFKKRVFPVVDLAALLYADAIGATRVELYDVLPELVPYYEKKGYRLVQEPDGFHLAKSVT